MALESAAKPFLLPGVASSAIQTARTHGAIQRTDHSGTQRSKKRLISSMKPLSSSLATVLSILE